MNRRITGKYYAYFLFCFACVCFAVVSRRLEPAMAAVPFFLSLVAAVAPRPAPRLRIVPRRGGDHVFEMDEISSGFSIHALSDIPLLEIVEVLPSDAVLVAGTNSIVACLASGERRDFDFSFRIPSRRSLEAGRIVVRVHDRTGFLCWEQSMAQIEPRVVFPRPYLLRDSIAPLHTQVFSGNYPSRVVGEGIEFADIRPFAPGDRAARINWKALGRTNRLYVNEFVTERNTDIVLLLDVFADLDLDGRGLLDILCRGAATLAHHYLRAKNRVGLIRYGALLDYLLPQPGNRQWYRILGDLSRARVAQSYVAQRIQSIPRRILPARALVVALTGLLDGRFSEALLDLRHRGFDTAAIYVPPPALLTEALGTLGPDLDARIAMRLWSLVCERRTAALQDAGLDIVSWLPGMPFDLALSTLNALRRERSRRV